MSNQNQKSPNVEHESQTDSSDDSRVQPPLSSQPPEQPATATPADDENSSSSQTANQETDKEIIFTTIISQVNQEDTIEGWMKALYHKIESRFKRMPNGWWRRIQTEFNSKHSKSCTLAEVKNLYTREKNRVSRIATEREPGARGEQPPPVIITNAALFKKVKDRLLLNIEGVMSGQGERKRTRKVYSHDQNHDVIDYMNRIIQNENLDQRATSLATLNDLIYACQLTYDEITEKPKKETNWKKSIENKIEKLDRQLEVINNHDQSDENAKKLVQMCKVRLMHSNNSHHVQQLKDQFEEQRAAYQKKIDVSEKRIAFRKDNKMFEFNRQMFYRNLSEEREEVDENINKQEVREFWQQMWSRTAHAENYDDLIETLDPVSSQVDTSKEKIASILEDRVKFLSNWKTPGPDQVYNFYIKRMHALHKRMTQIMCEAIENPDLIDETMYTGYTFLIPKVKMAEHAKELRPITCLPNMYKLLSKVITTFVSDMCEVNGVISENQLGTRRGCQGAKQQALLNKCLNQKYDNRLCTSWIDIQKAYDSVQHEYLIDVLKRIEVPLNIIKFVERTLALQQTNLICNREVIGKVRIEKGLLQGDSLSPLLFVLAMEPLSRKLNRGCEKLQFGNIERNHLVFIDDIKLFAEWEDELVEMCEITRDTLKKMGLQVNQAKSANNVSNPAAFGDELDDIKGYKYLGVLEDSRNVIKPENKQMISDQIKVRATKLCQTKLNAVNLFRGINEFALSTMNYYVGLLPYEPKEFDDIDKMVRRVLSDHKVTRNALNMDRLYLKRSNLGRGLSSAVEKSEVMLLKLYDFLANNPKARELVDFETREASHLGLIQGYLREKYKLNENEINEKVIKLKHVELRLERMKEKRMHSLLFVDEDNQIDRVNSSMWLMKGNITPQQEGMYCKLQDRNLYFGGATRCPHCNKGPKSVQHLATHCGRLLKTDYSKRHDEVVRCLHFMYAKKYGLNKSKRLKNYKVPEVISNDRVRIKSDRRVITENENISENKPDLLIHDYKAKEILLIEVGITNKNILPTTETTKGRKYEMLANELMCTYPGTRVTQIPVVMAWDGLVTNHFKRHMKQLQVSSRLQAYMQTVVLKRTCESILVDCRIQNNWIEEELSTAMDQLENNPAGPNDNYEYD